MSTVVNFNGKKIIEPGAYAATVYNPTSVVNVAEFGNVMIIDTGLSLQTVNGVQTEFAGGSGIDGALAKGMKSVYQFDSYEDFYAFMSGGKVADIADKIFTPMAGAAGAPKLFYARAATTTAATIVLTFASGVTLTLKCKNEGLCGNGITDGTDNASGGTLKCGYSARVVAGSTTETFVLQVLKGTFEGVDADGEPYGVKSFAEAVPQVIVESDECATLGELFDWCSNNKTLLSYFNVAKAGDVTTELIAVSQTLASGGTSQYLQTNNYDDVLEAIMELDITFFLCTNLNADSGAGVNASTNGKLFTFLKQNAKFREFMVVPGGKDSDDLFGESNCSQAIAKYYNSDQVVVVHGSPVVTRKDNNGTKELDPIYLAACVIGMNAGMAPQTPLTFKRVGYGAFKYDLKQKEREKALQAGIMHTRIIGGYQCINQGITTLQSPNNLQDIAPDGQSLELSISLIKSQLNKELVLESENRHIGLTAAQASPESVKNFTDTKLASFIATPGEDNLLISYGNIKVTAQGTNYKITYDFVPNVPVNKTFFVGNILEFSVTV